MNDTVFWGLLCAGTLIVTDYVTGVIKAVAAHDLQSEKMREGLAHKFAYLVVLFLGWFIEMESHHLDLGFIVPLFVPVVVAISLIEVTSILENCVEINPDLKTNKILALFANKDGNISVSPEKP